MEIPSEHEDEDVSMSEIIPIPMFVIVMEDYVARGNMMGVKVLILEQLLGLEAYEEIVELGLNKIKLN